MEYLLDTIDKFNSNFESQALDFKNFHNKIDEIEEMANEAMEAL